MKIKRTVIKMIKNKNKPKYEKNSRNCLNFLLSFYLIFTLIILFSFNAAATPIPIGIDGRIFYSDGVTQVFQNVPVIITNLDTNDSITGYTGKGTSGRYSFALPWESGTEISVRTYNPVHESIRNITLDGVIHNFDLILNMTLPNYAPEFTVENRKISVGHEYLYYLNVFDWNNDEVFANLIEFPSNMVIEKKSDYIFLINWTPSRNQTGINTVRINISDRINDSIQEFNLDVIISSNNPPIIFSDSETELYVLDSYSYKIMAEEPDGDEINYNLVVAPSDMILINDTLYWTPEQVDVGLHEISIKAIDSFGEYDSQSFGLWVLNKTMENEEENKKSSSSSSSLNKNVLNQTLVNQSLKNKIKLMGFKEINISISGLSFSRLIFDYPELINLEVEVKQLDKNTKKPQTQVYQYVEIIILNTQANNESKNSANYNLNDKINTEVFTNLNNLYVFFVVPKDWIYLRGLNSEDIILTVLREDEWEEILVSVDGEDSQNIFFKSSKFSVSEELLFAITHKKDKKSNLPAPDIKKIKEAFVVLGTANLKQDTQKICFKLKLETETLCLNVSELNDDKKYQVTINGNKNDVLQIFTVDINGKNSKIQELFLIEKINGFDIDEKGMGSLFTGGISEKVNKKIRNYLFGAIVLVVIFIVVIIFILKKRKLKKKKIKGFKIE